MPLVDTMLYINMPHYTYNWLDIGREGAVLSKWIFQQMYYNPYLATIAGYLFVIIGGNLFGDIDVVPSADTSGHSFHLCLLVRYLQNSFILGCNYWRLDGHTFYVQFQ